MMRPPPPRDFAGGLVDLDEETFEDFLRNHRLVLVDFWAPWCGPCRMVEPTLVRLALEQRRRLFIGRVNIDREPALMQRFQVGAVPTMLFFVAGKRAGIFVGAVPKSQMDRQLAKFLAAAPEELMPGEVPLVASPPVAPPPFPYAVQPPPPPSPVPPSLPPLPEVWTYVPEPPRPGPPEAELPRRERVPPAPEEKKEAAPERGNEEETE